MNRGQNVFGSKLRMFRFVKGWSLEDAAECFGTDSSHLSKWELGRVKPRKETVYRLTEIMRDNLSPEDSIFMHQMAMDLENWAFYADSK